MLVKYTVSEFLSAKGSFSSIDCVNIVLTKYRIASSKAVVGVDRPIKALSMHIQKPYKGIIV